MFIFGILSLLMLETQASDMDDKLQEYIKEFGLTPIEKITTHNSSLSELGKNLFFDKNLSGNRNINCAECHHPRVMTHDGLPLALGEGAIGIEGVGGRRQGTGKLLARNSPALFNLTNDLQFMFWDGRVSKRTDGTFLTPVPLREDIAKTITNAVAAQALFPMVDHAEMRGAIGSNPIANAKDEHEAWDLLTERVMSVEEYRNAFQTLYPNTKINIGHIAEAIAEFEKSHFALNDTAYDRYLKGDTKAMTEAQKMGMSIFFGKGQCGSCHSGAHLASAQFHNVGVPQIGPGKKDSDDMGRYLVTGNPKDLYAFKTPGLRNVAMTAPYMHNGSFKTLAQVIEHYDDVKSSLSNYKLVNNWKNYVEEISGHNHQTDESRLANLSPNLKPKIGFLEEEEKALAEFLRGALTDKRLLAQEITEDYLTYARFQLQESGFNKLLNHTAADSLQESSTYYYFDLMIQGAFALRELEQPIRIYVETHGSKSKLVYRKQLHKEAVSEADILLDGRFNKTEEAELTLDQTAILLTSYQDMFARIYQYVTPASQQEIPVTELAIIKSDVEAINHEFKNLPLKSISEISDLMNMNIANLFFVPTSFNNKETYTRKINLSGKPVKIILQSSFIRDEKGGFEKTWAIEFESDKTLKKDFPEFSKSIIQYLLDSGIVAQDIGGHTPSPSKTTEKILGQIYQ